MRVFWRWVVGCCLVLATVVASARASAAAPWVDRPLTLPRLVFAGDVGLGVAHRDVGDALVCIGGSPCVFGRGAGRNGITGIGANLEAAVGITDSVEIGLRTGVRFGTDGELVPADAFGRTLWTETYGTNADRVANPELRLRWAIHAGRVAEIGLDGRVYLPTEQGSSFGMMVGLPLAFHIADLVRIDTGVYVPVVFNADRSRSVSARGRSRRGGRRLAVVARCEHATWSAAQARRRIVSAGIEGEESAPKDGPKIPRAPSPDASHVHGRPF